VLPTLTLITVRFLMFSKISKILHSENMNMTRSSVVAFLEPCFNAHCTNHTFFWCNYLILCRFINRLKKSMKLHCSIIIATCICESSPICFSLIWTIDAIYFYFNRRLASMFVSKQLFQISWIFLQMPPHQSINFLRCTIHDRDA